MNKQISRDRAVEIVMTVPIRRLRTIVRPVDLGLIKWSRIRAEFERNRGGVK